MGIGVAAMTGLPALITSVIIASAAVFCSSMSRIHSGNNSSIGGILIWLVGITSLVTLTVTTVNEGGLSELLSKAYNIGKLTFPKLTPAPWVKGSLWGVLTVGIVLGFQIFAFSRSTLRNAIAKDLSDKAFYGYISTTFILMSIWTFIGFWAGICVSVVFNDTTEELPDGLLAKLVTKEMQNIKGFRGFFVSTLFAASISGLTRRYNQLVQLIWETSRDMCLSEAQRERSVSKLIKKNSIHLPEDYVKELTWEDRKRSCLSQFMFKLCMDTIILKHPFSTTGVTIGSLSCGIVYLFLGLGVTVWELWISILGIFIGPLIAAMLIGLFIPCISHMSVCLGLMVGWVIPCCLMIGNQNPNFDSYLSTQTRPVVPEKLENIYVPHPGSPLNFVDRPLKQTVFIYRCESCVEDQVNG
ncbi:Sodium-coupled monocarboxylate transporter 1 [Armadillidium vulgare]|nr:Sodium-coupled monocarboxylate transporter 1 [Armadillidium vulgare]